MLGCNYTAKDRATAVMTTTVLCSLNCYLYCLEVCLCKGLGKTTIAVVLVLAV